MREDVCEDCVAFQPGAGSYGTCRRNPPVLVNYGEDSRTGYTQVLSSWPEVAKDDWCLKYKEKEE